MGMKNRKNQRCRIDDQNVSNVQLDQPTQSVAEDSDHNLQEISTDSILKMAKTMPTELRNDLILLKAIIENDTNYTLHLLYMLVFHTICSMFTDYEEREETKDANQCNEKDEEEEISSSKDSELPNIENDGQNVTSFGKTYSSFSFPASFASYKYKKSKRIDSFYYGENSKYYNNFPIRPCVKRNVTEKKKALSVTFASANERKNVKFDKKKSEKHVNWRSEKETQENRRSFQYGPTKYISHYRRTRGNKGSKQYKPKYEDVGTQTDSTTNNVEMVSVGTMWPEQQSYGCPIEDRNIIRKLNYNHEADIGEWLRVAFQQLLSYTTSFSSTDLSFDVQIFTMKNAAALWPTNLFEDTNDWSAKLFEDTNDWSTKLFDDTNNWPTNLFDNTNNFKKPTRPLLRRVTLLFAQR